MNSSIIITPHGAAESNFIMVPNSMNLKKYITLIELCPPYTHCSRNDIRAPLCPYLYQKQFRNHKIFSIAREDLNWNCSEYRIHQKNARRFFKKEFLKIKSFIINEDLVIDAINYSKNYPFKTAKKFIKKVKIYEKEFYFYNSTRTISKNYFDLYKT